MNDTINSESRIITNRPIDNEDEIKVYPKRWLVLFIFSYISFLNCFNWIEFNAIQDVTTAFYNASLPDDRTEEQAAVNWFSMIYMLSYIPLVFPAMFFLDRKGLKIDLILGSMLTTVGVIIKIFATDPNLFLLAMFGQLVCSIAQTFTLSVPARLSALWFGESQVALATSIGVFGNQLGAAFGFLIPTYLVKLGTIKSMTEQFGYLQISKGILCFSSLVLTVLFVEDQPELPPSKSQLEYRKAMAANISNNTLKNDIANFKTSLVTLLSNINFFLIFISYGINVGSFYSISTLLNLIISEHYPGENVIIGYLGLILILSGLPGSILSGYILDKSKKFKLVTNVLYIGTFICLIIFTATLNIYIYLIFGTISILGLFMSGYLPVGFELATEMTYPEPEGLSTGLLNASAQAFGVLFVYVQGRIITSYNALYGNIFLCISLFIGTILTAVLKLELRRQNSAIKNENLVTNNHNEAINEAFQSPE